jgi:hypothetical protein
MTSNGVKSRSTRRIYVAGSLLTLALGLVPTLASAAEAPLSLGTASSYGVLANTTITSATASSVSGTAGGDIGIGSATAATGQISFSGAQVLGNSAIAALTSATGALNDARGGTSTVVELGAGRTITPGAYTGGELQINGSLTLDALGDPNAVFIFRAASTLITGVSSSVQLVNGAQACNVFWQIGSAVTLGTGSTMVGHVLSLALISTGPQTLVRGQLISLTGAVTLGGTTIINDQCLAAVTPVVTPTPVETATPVVTPTPVETPTVTGGILPDTSTPWGNVLLFGFGLTAIGTVGLATRKKLVR